MVRHCGRPPRRLGAGAAAHPRPGRPPARGDPAAPSFGLRPPSRSPAGLSSLPLPSSFSPSRPGAAATREPRRRSGAGPSREPRGVWDAGSGPRCPSLGPTRREQALGRGEGMGQRPGPCPAPTPALLCLAGDRGLGFRVGGSPARSRGFPLRPAGEKERLSRRSSPSSAPASAPLKSPGSFAWGGVTALFFLHHLSLRPVLLENGSFTGQLVEVIFTSSENMRDR